MSEHFMRWLAPLPALIAGAAHAEVYLTLAQAQAQMFPGELMTKLDTKLRGKAPKVWRASGGGWFFLDQVLGKHEYITYALALDATGAVRSLEILEYREHWGSEVRNARWRAQFTGKVHGAPLALGQDITNLSGATLSCRHVTKGVKRLLATHAELNRSS